MFSKCLRFLLLSPLDCSSFNRLPGLTKESLVCVLFLVLIMWTSNVCHMFMCTNTCTFLSFWRAVCSNGGVHPVADIILPSQWATRIFIFPTASLHSPVYSCNHHPHISSFNPSTPLPVPSITLYFSSCFFSHMLQVSIDLTSSLLLSLFSHYG